MKMLNTSTWKAEKPPHFYPKLKGSIDADVVIVGGGLVGVLSAYQLSKAGKKVVLLEAETLGSNATSFTTAFITQVIDTELSQLTALFGSRKAKLVWESHSCAIDEIERIVDKEKIECEFTRCSNYIFASENKEIKVLEKEMAAARKLGFSVRLGNKDLGIRHTGYLEVPNQAKFHPLKFLFSLADKASKNGAHIFEHSKVDSIEKAGSTIMASVGNTTVTAKDIIIATYDPFHKPKRTRLKKGMYKSYVLEAEIPAGLIAEATYEDLENPYHYFRIDPQGKKDRMIFGGEDHRIEIKMNEQKNFNALEKHLKDILDVPFTITRRWTGPILEPVDGIALIGKLYSHEYVAAAFSGNGMTYSTIASGIFNDEIMGRKNPYAGLYDPKRVPSFKELISKGRDYIGELYGGAIKNSMSSIKAKKEVRT